MQALGERGKSISATGGTDHQTLAGVIANLAGLSAHVDAEVVLRAVGAVYAASVLVAGLQTVLAWRLLRLAPAASLAAPARSNP